MQTHCRINAVPLPSCTITALRHVAEENPKLFFDFLPHFSSYKREFYSRIAAFGELPGYSTGATREAA